MRLTGPGVAIGLAAAMLTTGATTGHEQPAQPHAVVAATPVPVGLVLGNPKPVRLKPVSSPGRTENGVRATAVAEELPSANALGIPETVLAAYRNAELAMAASTPGCGITWQLLAGIGKIESGHAGGGNTDADGTTLSAILGPALDGTLPGNEIIRAADNTFVRAVGPMQFLPSTWAHYAADGNADGVADPDNVFDAALGAAEYLCSGGLDLRDPDAELRAVLRYNNSTKYAADVLGWAASYGSGRPTFVAPVEPTYAAPVVDVAAEVPAETVTPTEEPAPELPVAPAPPMIEIPGLPPIPCGIFCPPA